MGSPFEWLRSIARSRGDHDHLALEALSALGALAHDPAQLMVACRRVLAHHPTHGSLWWVASRLLAAHDVDAVFRDCYEQLSNDRTAGRLRDALPFLDDGQHVATIGFWGPMADALDERFDVAALAIVDDDDRQAMYRAEARAGLIDAWQLNDLGATLLLIPAHAVCTDRAIVSADTLEAFTEAPTLPSWLIAGSGRVVPNRLFDAMVAAMAVEASDIDETLAVIDLGRIEAVVTTYGFDAPVDLPYRIDCPVAPELLRPF